MYVIATAGHVDHGKSTLVRALTGMEPDRWAEERRRGMTIDLGFAWTKLPSGRQVAFVDVPGHQRFIGNMLAGLGPAPAVLFVVAADEGWSRQSSEHLAAIDALGIRHGLLAVTRSDLADPEPARRDAVQRLSQSSFGQVESVTVSGPTGEGLDGLRRALDQVADSLPPPDTAGPVRLWVDRSFTVRGAGTVVTGTLGAGSLTVGAQLQLDRQRCVRVRALQRLGVDEPAVSAVARVAVNLRGISHDEIGRGDVLLTPDRWRFATVVDVRLNRPAEGLAQQLVLHVGSAAVGVRVRALGADLARLSLPSPLPLAISDRAILRAPGEQKVAAGVTVLDLDPEPLRRRGAARRRAAELSHRDGRPDPVAELERRGALLRLEYRRCGGDPDRVPDSVRRVLDWLVTESTWQQWCAALLAVVEDDAVRSPISPGLPFEAARQRTGIPDLKLIPEVAAATALTGVAGRLRRADGGPDLGPAETGIRVVEATLARAPFAAPERGELGAVGLGRRELAAAERAGRLLRLADDVVLLPTAIDTACTLLAGLGRPFTVSQARQALGTTRRVAVPLLEYLDSHGRTHRIDDGLREVRVHDGPHGRIGG